MVRVNFPQKWFRHSPQLIMFDEYEGPSSHTLHSFSWKFCLTSKGESCINLQWWLLWNKKCKHSKFRGTFMSLCVPCGVLKAVYSCLQHFCTFLCDIRFSTCFLTPSPSLSCVHCGSTASCSCVVCIRCLLVSVCGVTTTDTITQLTPHRSLTLRNRNLWKTLKLREGRRGGSLNSYVTQLDYTQLSCNLLDSNPNHLENICSALIFYTRSWIYVELIVRACRFLMR